jgi:hypothetical protein
MRNFFVSPVAPRSLGDKQVQTTTLDGSKCFIIAVLVSYLGRKPPQSVTF